MNFINKLFPSRNDRMLKDYRERTRPILALEATLQELDDQALRQRFIELKERFNKGTSLDDLLTESFAITREVCDRRLGAWNVFDPTHGFNWNTASSNLKSAFALLNEAREAEKPTSQTDLPAAFYKEIRSLFSESRPPFRMQSFPVQLMGGIVLHEGKVAEMKTGEGKTLTSVNAVVLNAIAGPVYVVTVNDYLARRDAAWMAPAYEFLNLSNGALQSQMPGPLRRAVYDTDIIYGTNSEFGFDYLRDNMASDLSGQVQKKRLFAVVDEVDSVLIDEARTPLIISGQPDSGVTNYTRANEVARYLKIEEDFTVDEKQKSAVLTEAGVSHCEEVLGLGNIYQGKNMEWPHLIENAVQAQHVYVKDKDYVVQENPESQDIEVIIVDEFTGRLQYGRRWSSGLHQAIEAKEGLGTKEESITLATVTIQNYFRMFEKLSGMTGTAFTEALEFDQIYSLDVVVVPTNRPMVRQDYPDVIYANVEAKFRAIAREIVECNKTGQPVLVGTTSVAKSEDLSRRLKKSNIKHEVLNAKNHEREAEIVAKAGQRGSVTIATNMAGRGTDIVLGKDVRDKGLHVIGTERHESRRIDNQLRGRSGRQGDPGSTRFFLSLEDDLIRIFAGDWMRNMMAKNLPEDESIESKLVTRSIEKAQKKVEEHHFGIRKNLIEFDDVKDEQRKYIYELRQDILENKDIKSQSLGLVEDALQSVADSCLSKEIRTLDRDPQPFIDYCRRYLDLDVKHLVSESEKTDADQLVDEVVKIVETNYTEIEDKIGQEQMELQISYLLLYALDNRWKEHLSDMDHLRTGIGMRGYAQIDPKVAFKQEGYELFSVMLAEYAQEVTSLLLKIEVAEEEAQEELSSSYQILDTVHEEFSEGAATDQKQMAAAAPRPAQAAPKTPRNAPCPCGSGKKFKNCHGKTE